MYDDDYNCEVWYCHWKIKEIDNGNIWKVWAVWEIVGGLGLLFDNHMFCVDVVWYIVETFRGNLVGKVNVERWGQFLILVKR